MSQVGILNFIVFGVKISPLKLCENLKVVIKMTSLSKSMPHCQYFDPKGVNFMTPMSKKKQCGQDYDKDVMIAGFPLLHIHL